MDDPFDESGRAGGAGEDRVPIGEGEIGGQHDALLLVAPTDDLEDQVGVSIVEGEEAELVDDEESDLRVIVEAPVEGGGGLGGAEGEEGRGGREEEKGGAGEDGARGDVLGD